MACKAYQVSDQKRCERCDLTWDMNDVDPPACLTLREVGQMHLDKARASLTYPLDIKKPA